jgi:hypothetical protein
MKAATQENQDGEPHTSPRSDGTDCFSALVKYILHCMFHNFVLHYFRKYVKNVLVWGQGGM